MSFNKTLWSDRRFTRQVSMRTQAAFVSEEDSEAPEKMLRGHRWTSEFTKKSRRRRADHDRAGIRAERKASRQRRKLATR